MVFINIGLVSSAVVLNSAHSNLLQSKLCRSTARVSLSSLFNTSFSLCSCFFPSVSYSFFELGQIVLIY